MGSKGLFPVVAVPLAFFGTFFRFERKYCPTRGGSPTIRAVVGASGPQPGQGVCACGRTKELSARPLETFGHRSWRETRRRQVLFPRQSWRTTTQAGVLFSQTKSPLAKTPHLRSQEEPPRPLRVLPPPLPRIDFPRSQITLPAPERKGTPHALFRRW